MPRPRKWRKVCCKPKINQFGPIGQRLCENNIVTMTVEEYETIRLIDFENMTQEECSEQMSVARTTVQRIYNDARKKLANTLVNGNFLVIEGGDYRLCDENDEKCGRCCRRHYNNQVEQCINNKMED